MKFYACILALLFAAPAFAHLNQVSTVQSYTGPDRLYEDTFVTPGEATVQNAGDAPPALCVQPTVASTCCNYTIKDDYATSDVFYTGPGNVFSDETKAREFAAKQIPKMMFLLPVGSENSVVAGWHYSSGTHHSALDFWRTAVTAGQDVSVKVSASAPGRVISKHWDNWFGNTVILEHVAKDGSKYRTIYMHLRDGYTHDLTNAKGVTAPDPTVVDNWTKYVKYAHLNNPNALYWGSESSKIAVKAGDLVKAGQFIAWSGNTGAGGAGNGLNADGTPSDSTRANNHLHFMLAVPNPLTAGQWVFIDSMGVYETNNAGCYDVMKDTQYKRFFATYYPSFHDVDSSLVIKYFDYYPGMGLNPQTLAPSTKDGALRLSGAFASAAPSPWYAYVNMDTPDFSSKFTSLAGQGFRPRQLSVMLDGSGQPHFAALWKKTAGEGFYLWLNMTDVDLTTKWNELVVRQGFRVDDFASYVVAGKTLHAAIFVKDGVPFYLYRGMTTADLQAKFNQLYAQGFYMTSIQASEPGGTSFAGVWQKIPGKWAAYAGMSSTDYQAKFNELSAQGFRLYKLQSYANTSKFAAIWTK